MSDTKTHTTTAAPSAGAVAELKRLGSGILGLDVRCSSLLQDYELHNEIGVGAFATVYRARETKLRKTVAVKVTRWDTSDTQASDLTFQQVCDEVRTMSLLKHPNLVPVCASFVHDDGCYLVMPLMEFGSCASILQRAAPGGFKDEALLASLLKPVLDALVYLHNDAHIHRDIKAANLFVDQAGNVLLGDFGVSGTLLQGGMRVKRQTLTGSPCWMAPEIIESKDYDAKVDIWSLGIAALELAYGHPPYIEHPPIKAMLLIAERDPPTCDLFADANRAHTFSKAFDDFVRRCLQKDPAKRPTAKMLLQHAFVKHAKDAAYVQAALRDRYRVERLDMAALQQAQAGRNQSLSPSADHSDKGHATADLGDLMFDFDDDVGAGTGTAAPAAHATGASTTSSRTTPTAQSRADGAADAGSFGGSAGATASACSAMPPVT